MTTISLILFDLNGVLYRYDREARIAHLAAVSGLDAPAVKAAIWDSGFEDSGDAGVFDADAYLRGFAARLGHDLSEQAWIAAQLAAVTPIAETLALLPRLTVRRAVLTNNNLLVLRNFATLYPDIAGYDPCVSAEFGARKPDPEAYLRCLARLGVEPAATLFIDDSTANVDGARRAGLQAHAYTGTSQLVAELQGRGLLRE